MKRIKEQTVNKNSNFVLGLKLLIITAVVGLALALTNSVTAPIVAARQAEELKESLSVVYPADSYEEVETEKPESIEKVYKAISADGEGYVFQINSPGGYGGDIEFLIGVDPDNKITGFAPLNHSESAGFGARMEEDFFSEGMVGVSMDGEVKASEAGGENEIVGISGATISTTTILRGINDAREVLETLK